jgi:thiamine pyrophosphate-dependent acetolactate synthase large subunit-like protein
MSKRVVEMIVTPEQPLRKTVATCQTALTKRDVAVLVVPADIANAASDEEGPFVAHVWHPFIRTSDADLDEIVAILNGNEAITINPGTDCASAHDQAVGTAAWLKGPVHHRLHSDEGPSGDLSGARPGFHSASHNQNCRNSWLSPIPLGVP